MAPRYDVSVQHLPEGISDLEEDGTTWSMKVSIPSDEEGFFGRLCPGCGEFFKLDVAEFKAAPDQLFYCPYCGHQADAGDHYTDDQRERALSAAKAIAIAKIQDMIGELPSGPIGGGLISISWEFKPGTPPSLHTYVEEQVRRTVTCEMCARNAAVYGAATFCPYCGPRPVSGRVLDELEAQRLTLSVFDQLPPNVHEEARAAGVIDGLAADTIKNVVTLFEQLCRETFAALVPPAFDVLKKQKERSNVFQNLDDAARLFASHTSLSLHALVNAATWERLRVAFAKRHVLTHANGIVDQRFLDQVPHSPLKVGQRLVITRREAQQALDDLQTLVGSAASATATILSSP